MNISEKINPEFENTQLGVEQPKLTSQQFAKLASINARVRDLKQNGFDMREYLDSVKKETARVELELEKTREELIEKTSEMQQCFKEYIHEPYGITGQISISETEPHYITVVDSAPQQSYPDEE